MRRPEKRQPAPGLPHFHVEAVYAQVEQRALVA
jgi:hypothetical protein